MGMRQLSKNLVYNLVKVRNMPRPFLFQLKNQINDFI